MHTVAKNRETTKPNYFHRMKFFWILLTLVLLISSSLARDIVVAQSQSSNIAVIEINDDIVMPVTVRFIERAIRQAEQSRAELIVVYLDTPGGLLDSTNDIVATIFAAQLPVVVYVAPAGARAASAGTFIAAAAHVAVMAPGTNIGAATPVSHGGEDLENKVSQDTAASIRSIAEERGRNIDALEKTVVYGVSYTASEALENNVVDLIAGDLSELLNMLDDWDIQLLDRSVLMQTKDLEIRRIDRTILERFLGFIVDPNVILILLVLGGIGILIEIIAPGLFVPGVTGLILLALAFVAIGNLPVNFLGLGLLLLSLVLFYLEIQAPGVSVAGVGGATAFILGSLLLFGDFNFPGIPSKVSEIPVPGLRVNVWMVVGVSFSVFSLVGAVVWQITRARIVGMRSHSPSLIGEIGITTSALNPKGTVHVAGEYWTAISDSHEVIAEGEKVVVSEMEGLTLQVFNLSAVERPCKVRKTQNESTT